MDKAVTVYFSHGKESGPWGSKITRLANVAEKYGCRVVSIDYTEIDNPDARVSHLLQKLAAEENDTILVGSSMGGYVSLVAAQTSKPKGLFLMAPALYMDGYEQQEYHCSNTPIEIIQGWKDTITIPEGAIRFASQQRCRLQLIDSDHPFSDALETIADSFELFLRRVLSGTPF